MAQSQSVPVRLPLELISRIRMLAHLRSVEQGGFVGISTLIREACERQFPVRGEQTVAGVR